MYHRVHAFFLYLLYKSWRFVWVYVNKELKIQWSGSVDLNDNLKIELQAVAVLSYPYYIEEERSWNINTETNLSKCLLWKWWSQHLIPGTCHHVNDAQGKGCSKASHSPKRDEKPQSDPCISYRLQPNVFNVFIMLGVLAFGLHWCLCTTPMVTDGKREHWTLWVCRYDGYEAVLWCLESNLLSRQCS